MSPVSEFTVSRVRQSGLELLLEFHLEREAERALHAPLQIKARNEWTSCPSAVFQLSLSLSLSPFLPRLVSFSLTLSGVAQVPPTVYFALIGLRGGKRLAHWTILGETNARL